ncbi:MAG: zinc-ribbon domain-containing protein, partial [Candidatus Thiodiazotropha sp.]
MFTQCPHCMTLFRITSEQLKAAEGRVRCCQCNQIFNALQRLQELPKAFNNLATTSQYVEMEHADEDAVLLESPEVRLERTDSTLINDSEFERTLDDLADDSTPVVPSLSEDSNLEDDQLSPDTHSQMLFEQDDGLEPEPEYFAEGTESQMSELLDQDSASLLL